MKFVKAGMFFLFFLSPALLFADDTEDVKDFVKELEKDLAAISQTASPSPVPAKPSQEETVESAPSEGETASPAPEEESKRPPAVVTGVEIRGNSIVSTNTILSKLKTQKGAPLVQETINEDLKRLYATGFFEDIKVEVVENPEGYTLAVAVIEKPIVKKIVFQGFGAFKEEKIRKEFKMIEGQILDRKAVKAGAENLRKLYRDKGYRFMDVSTDVDINYLTKEATVMVQIREGTKYRIKGVRFEGVKSFSPRKLQKMMKTKSRAVWLLRSGVFKPAHFDKDLERVRLFYQQEGFLDAKVASDFEYDDKKQQIFVKMMVEEGNRYETGEIKIEGSRLFPESEIWQELEMLPGTTFSQYYLAKDVDKIREFYHRRGYMDTRIIPDTRLNKATNKVDVAYTLEEGDLYFVEKVAVRGNTKTKDLVIRRELRIRPGDRFDGDKIQKSKQRLDNLGYFEEVTYDTEPSQTAPNRKDLIFRVKEKRTGELSFGGGVSSVDSFVGFVQLSQKNFDLLNWPRFTGGGQSVSLDGRFGTINQQYNFNFTEPYVFNKPFSFSQDLFHIRRDDKRLDFDEQRTGFSSTFSKEFKDIFRVGTGYTLERVNLDEISDDAPKTVRDFEGKNWLSRIRLFNTLDTRDNIFNPTKGIHATLSGDLVGSFLGGDQDFYMLQTSITKYWNLFKKHVLETRFRLGTSQEFGDSDEVPIFDRFYAGGLGTVRGFNSRRVGPVEAGNPVGGQTMMLANAEYTVPVLRLDAFRFAFFVDAGQVSRDSYDINFGDISISIGPGLKIKTPIGPIAFYYGFPLANKDTEDRNGRFEFSLSRGF